MFENLYVGRIVVRALMHDLEDRTETLAFVVMPDHVHWLFRLLDDASLSDVVRRFKGLSARRVNDKLNRQGSVWQRGAQPPPTQIRGNLGYRGRSAFRRDKFE